MNLSCKIIQDLLLLYTDDACSQESRIAVEEHLAHCPACRRHMEALKLPEAMAEPIPEPTFCPMELALNTRPSARMPECQSLYSTVSASIPYMTPDRAAFPIPLTTAAVYKIA